MRSIRSCHSVSVVDFHLSLGLLSFFDSVKHSLIFGQSNLFDNIILEPYFCVEGVLKIQISLKENSKFLLFKM